MRRLLALFCFLLASASWAAEVKYPVSTIPPELTNGMYAVIRLQEQDFEIVSKAKSRYRFKRVITILNSQGRDHAVFVIGYDKEASIDFVEGAVYDAMGKQIKKIRNSDIVDRASTSGYSLYEDNRVKIADLRQESYPYTVEIEYQKTSKLLYSIPGFYLYEDDEVSAEQLAYQITYPVSLKPRYKMFRSPDPQKTLVGKDLEQLAWKFSNVKPDKFERYAPEVNRVVPNIALAPSDFEYDGYAGSMTTWKSIGQWQLQLNAGRDILPEATRAKVRQLTSTVPNEADKVKVLYEFMQGKTRYVSIQLGIGGLQPFDAKTVDEVGYGDCKALSNYMVALLKEVGIKGYYCWVYGGEGMKHLSPDFPIDYFNHIIVAVPQKKDTIWLECTSQIAPFGFLGDFTSDRYALMVTEDGGKLVRTPKYGPEINQQIRVAHVDVQPTGDAQVNMTTRFSGTQTENGGLDGLIASNQIIEQKKWLERSIDFPSFTVKSFSMSTRKFQIPTSTVSAELELRKAATINGKRLFIAPNLFGRFSYVPEKIESRNTPVVRHTAYTDVDTIKVKLPEMFHPEFIPPAVLIKTRFGEYSGEYKVENHTIFYFRKLKMVDGEFPAESYGELVEFFKNISKADNTKMVFVNKT
ncbi:MAG: DUF3857 domain-containing transglutaminase family protein [Cyclobacteriaceae bacterium]|jgi:hypothetical protein